MGRSTWRCFRNFRLVLAPSLISIVVIYCKVRAGSLVACSRRGCRGFLCLFLAIVAQSLNLACSGHRRCVKARCFLSVKCVVLGHDLVCDSRLILVVEVTPGIIAVLQLEQTSLTSGAVLVTVFLAKFCRSPDLSAPLVDSRELGPAFPDAFPIAPRALVADRYAEDWDRALRDCMLSPGSELALFGAAVLSFLAAAPDALSSSSVASLFWSCLEGGSAATLPLAISIHLPLISVAKLRDFSGPFFLTAPTALAKQLPVASSRMCSLSIGRRSSRRNKGNLVMRQASVPSTVSRSHAARS